MIRFVECLAVALIACLQFSCSSISLDEIEKEEAKKEKQTSGETDDKADETQAEQLENAGNTSTSLHDLTEIPVTLSGGDYLCGMLVLDVDNVADEYNKEYLVVTLLSNTEWMNVPSAYAEGELANHAQMLASQCKEAGMDAWQIPTKEQAKIIRTYSQILSSEIRYLCTDAKNTYAVGSNMISKAGAKKRYGLRFVLEAYFEIE